MSKPRWYTTAFSHFARRASHVTGRAGTFALACTIIVVWACLGPVFQYSDDWQLWINTSTTIITFLMVFLIQHSQEHDTLVLQLKLDELIRSDKGAHNQLISMEEMEEEELEQLHKHFHEAALKAASFVERKRKRRRGTRTKRR